MAITELFFLLENYCLTSHLEGRSLVEMKIHRNPLWKRPRIYNLFYESFVRIDRLLLFVS